ncbi:MAG: hypothetical protein DRP45_00470 [Candidatus Zixiibacteriota bacterium]|nr:MAG: hypothetical protein DRP45_00470 [candidate division Zixibacteria bacterium]
MVAHPEESVEAGFRRVGFSVFVAVQSVNCIIVNGVFYAAMVVAEYATMRAHTKKIGRQR